MNGVCRKVHAVGFCAYIYLHYFIMLILIEKKQRGMGSVSSAGAQGT